MQTRLAASARRRQLLDAAVDAFAERGFHATSMNDVADAAGVTKPVLYQHFGSKRSLYQELLDDVADTLLARIEAATATGSPRSQVEAGFSAYFRFVDERRSGFTLLFGSGARRDAEFAGTVRRLEAAVAEWVASLIDADLDDAHRRALAYGIVGLAEATSRYWVSGALDLPPEVLARQAADLAWRGLRGVERLPLPSDMPASS
jgi:AcrR family transcriptional regulator